MNSVQSALQAVFGLVAEELPPPTSDYARHEDRKIPMRDGVELMTRIFYPTGEGPWPTILVRNPYTPVNHDAYMQQAFLVFLKYGYAVVYQQVRGVFDSGGEWNAFENEREDGLDTVNWLARQPFVDGIGTYGGSYLGHVQWCMADALPPAVKALYISVYGGDAYDLFYENGLFKQGTWTVWATQMIRAREERENLSTPSLETFWKAAAHRPQSEMDRALFGVDCRWYRNWISHADPAAGYWNDGFWGRFNRVAERVQTPVTFQTGWFDIFLPSALRTFARLNRDVREKSRLVVGPWHHGNRPGGELSYPNENALGTLQLKDALAWFGHHLKGEAMARPSGVTAYTIQEGRWRATSVSQALAPRPCRTLYLHPDHTLQDRRPPDGERLTYVYDPKAYVPTRGGNLLTNYRGGAEPECAVRQEPPDWRPDVLSFVSPPLTEDLRIAGTMNVRLRVASDAADTAFVVKVMEVTSEGTYNIREAGTTLSCALGGAYEPGRIVSVDIACTGICWLIKAGNRLRLDVTSSSFPAYHIHPNLAGPWADVTESRPAVQTLVLDQDGGACLEIPVGLSGGEPDGEI